MTADQLSRPKFRNETEEAEWWYDHREELAVIDAQTIREGRAQRRTLESAIAEGAGRRIARELGLTDADYDDVAKVAGALRISVTECLRRLVLARVHSYTDQPVTASAREAA